MSPSTVDSNAVQRDAPRRGDVDDAGGDAGGDRVEQELHRRRAVAGADEHRGVVRVVDERLGAGGVLLARAVEALDRGAAVHAVTHSLRARNWNCAAAGWDCTTSRVANRVGTSTPLRAGRLVVVVWWCWSWKWFPFGGCRR